MLLLRRSDLGRMHVKQIGHSERFLARALQPVFSRSIASTTNRIAALEIELAPENAQRQAAEILAQTYDAGAELRDLQQACVDTLPFVFVRAALQELEVGREALSKSTSAEDIAARLNITPPDGVSIGQMPDWLRAAAARVIGEAFDEDYWLRIPETTREDIAATLIDSIETGKSIKKTAAIIAAAHGPQYSRMRATRVARTEVPNALNAGHTEGIRRLSEETGFQVGKEWLSVLGTTTRHTHAALDGVQTETPDGLFALGGVEVPWPAHHSLPAHERINCQCTIVSAISTSQLLPEEPEPEPPKQKPKPKPGAKPIPDLPELEYVSTLGGSTGAQKFKDADGNFYVVKTGSSPDHLIEEYLAEELYRAGGANIPRSRLTSEDGHPVKISEWVEGTQLKDLSPTEQKKAFTKIRKDFGADALFANWDVAGLDLDNVLIDKAGKPYRIDTGGALRFRAQGSPKGELFTDNVLELWSLRDPSINAQSALTFDMKPKAVRTSVKKTLKKRKAIMKRLGELEARGLIKDDGLRKKLEARFDSLDEYVKTSEAFIDDQWEEDYTDEFAKQEMQMRQAGIFDRLPKSMRNPRGDWDFVDENGKEFDHLRGEDSIVKDFSDYLSSQGLRHSDIAEYADDQAGSSWSEKAQTVKVHLAASRKRPLTSYFWGLADSDIKRALPKGRAAVQRALDDRIKDESSQTPANWRKTMIAQHAFTYNFLKKTDLPNSDRKRGLVSLGRTENRAVLEMNGFTSSGDNGLLKRGALESFGLTNTVDVSGPHLTYQEMPHTRVFGTYLHARAASGYEARRGMFLGDSENEFVCLSEGVETTYDEAKPSGSPLEKPEQWKKKRKRQL